MGISAIHTTYLHKYLGEVTITGITDDRYFYRDYRNNSFSSTFKENDLTEIRLATNHLTESKFVFSASDICHMDMYKREKFHIFHVVERDTFHYQMSGKWIEVMYLSQLQTIVNILDNQ